MNKILKLNLILVFSFSLSACGKNDHLIKIQAEMKSYEQEIQSSKKSVAFTPPGLPQGVRFKGNHVTAGNFNAEKSNQQQTRKKEVSADPLLKSSVLEYQYLGTLENNDMSHAYVKAPDNLVYELKLGSKLGDDGGKVTNITSDTLEVTETSIDVKQPPKKIVLKLKD